MVCPHARAPLWSAACETEASLSDIFDEVDEDLRAERVRKIFQRYGGLMVGAAVLVVAGVAGWQGWTWYQAREANRAATAYLTATAQLDDPKVVDRKPALDALAALAKDGSPAYRTLARLREAAVAWDAGDKPAALALWNSVAADSAADPLLRDIASLQWAMHQIDAGDAGQVGTRLAALAGPENKLHALAQEGEALLAIRQGKPDAARDILRRLAQDTTAPDGVRARANGLLAQLGSGTT